MEFGTSFGISDHLSRLRGLGQWRACRPITTELEPAKMDRAKRTLAAAGVEERVELRIGDARETLSDSSQEIDMIFLGGAKELYFDVCA